MKTFIFTNTQYITARDKSEAKRIFYENSHGFTDNVKIVELDHKNEQKQGENDFNTNTDTVQNYE